jgi:nucleoside phosphorylase
LKRYFDAIVIVPLEEEFEIALANFDFEEDLTNEKQIMFSVSVRDQRIKILLAKQSRMGKTAAQEAVLNCLDAFDAGTLICIGIAGGLSSDVAIGDVCYSGSIIDVLDNAKTSDTPVSTQDLALSPTIYSTPQEITISICLDRLNPASKANHEAWAEEREKIAQELIPNGFSGRNGKKENIVRPSVREGSIACGLVSGSPAYNKKLMAIDRKMLAIETESGGLFSVAQQRGLSALTVRGISDYAGIDKNKFEEETGNNARKIAIENAASFLARQLGTPRMIAYFDKIRVRRTNEDSQLPLLPITSGDEVFDILVKLSDAFNNKLHDLAPGYSLQSKGYRLPVPRIRTIGTRSGDPRGQEPIEVRDALRDARIITLHVPKEYPDLSLSWIIANDLLSAQLGEKKIIPCVVEGGALQRPRTGIAQLIDPQVLTLAGSAIVQNVFIIDDFNFKSKTRLAFLKEQIDEWADAKFIVVTRSGANVILESEFTRNIASSTARVCDVSFMEISHFLQKNFEMSASASEVVAVRLRETFRKYALPAHPSYFAGIPRNTLNALLQVNRRAELIELAVVGYLSFVVAEDMEPIILSRTTREKFLAELAFSIRADGHSFTEAQLTAYAEDFASKYDFNISPARFVALFIEKRILHVEDGCVRFTLPFIESYLLAKRLTEDPKEAAKYFSVSAAEFDHRTFALYAEMGAADGIVRELDLSIRQMAADGKANPILLSNTVSPAMLQRADRVGSFQKQLRQAEEDVRNDRDQSQAKQRLLDASDRIREEAETRLSEMQFGESDSGKNGKPSIEADAVAVWSIVVSLLGSGAERLEAQTKRELVSKIIKLSCLIIDGWTRSYLAVNFADIKKAIIEKGELVSIIAKSQSESDLKEATKTIEYMVEFLEYMLMLQPFASVVSYLCEEARDNVLAESIVNTSVPEGVEDLLRNMWLSDIDAPKGTKGLLRSIKVLPKTKFLRSAIAGHLMARVYWRHWRKQDKLLLLNAADECLKGTGLQNSASELKRIMEKLPKHR